MSQQVKPNQASPESMIKPQVKEFFDSATWTLTYVVYDAVTKDALVIDPVWDYDPAASKLSRNSANEVEAYIKEKGLNLHFILETHAHADHLSGSQILKERFPNAKIGIGSRIQDVQKVFKNVFNLDENFRTDGSQFDFLLNEEQVLRAGSLEMQTIFTPGHTPACATYVIGDAAFTGDALFMPDYGTGRCDFPAGSAEDLYHSVKDKIYQLPDHFRVYVGHDYLPNGRDLAFQSSIGEEKRKNFQLNAETRKEDFVEFRNKRDKTLAAPKLLLPSVQVNINAGQLPEADAGGARFLKIPIR